MRTIIISESQFRRLGILAEDGDIALTHGSTPDYVDHSDVGLTLTHTEDGTPELADGVSTEKAALAAPNSRFGRSYASLLSQGRAF